MNLTRNTIALALALGVAATVITGCGQKEPEKKDGKPQSGTFRTVSVIRAQAQNSGETIVRAPEGSIFLIFYVRNDLCGSYRASGRFDVLVDQDGKCYDIAAQRFEKTFSEDDVSADGQPTGGAFGRIGTIFSLMTGGPDVQAVQCLSEAFLIPRTLRTARIILPRAPWGANDFDKIVEFTVTLDEEPALQE